MIPRYTDPPIDWFLSKWSLEGVAMVILSITVAFIFLAVVFPGEEAEKTAFLVPAIFTVPILAVMIAEMKGR